jgi:hypothetical protein
MACSLAGDAPPGSSDFPNPAGNLVVDLVSDDAAWRPIDPGWSAGGRRREVGLDLRLLRRVLVVWPPLAKRRAITGGDEDFSVFS